jgi:hypothetical protein
MVKDTLLRLLAGPEARTTPDAAGLGRSWLICPAICGERHPSLGFLGTSGRKGAAQLSLITCD